MRTVESEYEANTQELVLKMWRKKPGPFQSSEVLSKASRV